MQVSDYHAMSVKIGDLVKRKTIRPEYGVIIDLQRLQGGTMEHRRLTILWDDGDFCIEWPQNIEIINANR